MQITPDSIPSSEQVRDTFLDRIYYPYQKQIFAGAAVLAIAIVAVLAVRQWNRTREDTMWARYYAIIDAPASSSASYVDQAASLEALITEFPNDSVTPHAMRERVFAHAQGKQWDETLAALAAFSARYPDDDFFRIPRGNPAAKKATLADWMQENVEKERKWEQESRYEHVWPGDSRLALVETTAGSFWVGFYEEQAPTHVANFVRRAKSGDFNGTQVFVVRKDTAGSPQSFSAGTNASKARRDEPWEHDESDPVLSQAPEASRFQIRHLRRIVTSVAGSGGDSGEAFMVIAAEPGITRFDGDSTPFGAVMEREGSLAAMDRIASAPTYESAPDTQDAPGTLRVREHPYPNIYIRRVTIWTDEKLEDGHTWDTSLKATDSPEPWEADLPAAWKPEKATPPGGNEPEKGADPGTDEDKDEDEAGKTPGEDE